jgi:hypothetical protein
MTVINDLRPLDDLFGKETPDYLSMTLEEYWEQVFWPVRKGDRVEPTAPVAAPSTWKRDLPRYNRMWEKIGQVRLRDLNPWVFQRFLDGLDIAGSGKVLFKKAYKAQGTARRVLTLHERQAAQSSLIHAK